MDPHAMAVPLLLDHIRISVKTGGGTKKQGEALKHISTGHRPVSVEMTDQRTKMRVGGDNTFPSSVVERASFRDGRRDDSRSPKPHLRPRFVAPFVSQGDALR